MADLGPLETAALRAQLLEEYRRTSTEIDRGIAEIRTRVAARRSEIAGMLTAGAGVLTAEEIADIDKLGTRVAEAIAQVSAELAQG